MIRFHIFEHILLPKYLDCCLLQPVQIEPSSLSSFLSAQGAESPDTVWCLLQEPEAGDTKCLYHDCLPS